MLVFTLIFTLTLPMFQNIWPRAAEDTEADSGVGGGLLPELIVMDSGIEEAFDLLGIPDPGEFTGPKPLMYNSYRVARGDTIGEIAKNAGLNEDTLLSVNNIKNSRLLQIGQILKIPNQDGICHTVIKGDSLSVIGEKYDIDPDAIRAANELFSDTLVIEAALFVPGARMDWVNKQEINGDLFIWPIRGYITSAYGYRENPFGGGRQFHYGMDIGAQTGTIIKAAMAGRVTTTGFNSTYGNYVIISHHSGYRTLYAHMSAISVKSGAAVNAGEQIGRVGSTGKSTGPHLHFTVYKNGVTVNPRNLMK